MILLLVLLASPSCAGCHPAIAQRHALSHHAQALWPMLQSPLASRFESAKVAERDGATFSYSKTGEAMRVLSRLGADSASASLQWLFGAGAQAVTPVGIFRNRYFEHRLSYYARQDAIGRTFGHRPGPSATAELGLGITQSSDTIYRCFNCHAYGVKPGPDLSALQAGVTCQRCHGEGAGHPTGGIFNPGSMNAHSLVQFCADCHRSPDNVRDAPEIDDPVTVRFAPIGFMASKCFTSSSTFSCTTCHDPHANAPPRTNLAYSERCSMCHTSPPSSRSRCSRMLNRNCLPCHMDRVELTKSLRFTDHRIRVLKQPHEE